MLPHIPKITTYLLQAISFLENVRKYLLSKTWVRYALRKRLFTLFPIVLLSLQLHIERKEIRRRGALVTELTGANEFLRERLNGYHTKIDDFDFPVWEKVQKDGEFRMLSVNERYVEFFLRDRGLRKWDAVGRTSYDLYPPEAATLYHTQDSMVVATGQTSYLVNEFPGIGPILVVRWIRTDRGDVVLMGAALSINKIKEEVEKLGINGRSRTSKQDYY